MFPLGGAYGLGKLILSSERQLSHVYASNKDEIFVFLKDTKVISSMKLSTSEKGAIQMAENFLKKI